MDKKLPKLVVQKTGNYRLDGAYLMTILDKEQREKYSFLGDNNKEYTLYTPTEYENDERKKHPNIGVVVNSTGDTQFLPGDKVIVEHNSFRYNVGDYDVLYTDEEGVEYYRVMNYNIFARINDDSTLTPRKYILLCEPLKDKLVDTFLHIPEEYIDYRRDVVRITDVWEGCTEYKPGDYILLRKNADYPIDFNGKRVVKVDTASGIEVEAIVEDPSWRFKNTHRHERHHRPS